MTDREMLLLAYGALMTMKNSSLDLVDLIKEHLDKSNTEIVSVHGSEK